MHHILNHSDVIFQHHWTNEIFEHGWMNWIMDVVSKLYFIQSKLLFAAFYCVASFVIVSEE